MDYIDIRFNDKYYVQRAQHSKIIEFDEENRKNNVYNSYEELPEDVREEIENVINIRKNPTSIFKYNELDDGTVKLSIMKNNINIRNLIIPEYINGLKVSQLGPIPDMLQIERVVMPNSVTNLIGQYFCYGKNNLKEVVLSENLKTLPEYTFYNCKKLTKINLENVNTVRYMCFYNCQSLKDVNLNKLVYVAGHSFSLCSEITNLILPSIKVICANAFLCNAKLQNLVLGPNLDHIGREAFKNCTQLNNVIIPNKVKTIEVFSFKNCKSLSNIVFPDGLEKIGASAFEGCGFVGTMMLPRKIRKIEKFAFSGCDLDTIYVDKQTECENVSNERYVTYDSCRSVEER